MWERKYQIYIHYTVFVWPTLQFLHPTFVTKHMAGHFRPISYNFHSKTITSAIKEQKHRNLVDNRRSIPYQYMTRHIMPHATQKHHVKCAKQLPPRATNSETVLHHPLIPWAGLLKAEEGRHQSSCPNWPQGCLSSLSQRVFISIWNQIYYHGCRISLHIAYINIRWVWHPMKIQVFSFTPSQFHVLCFSKDLFLNPQDVATPRQKPNFLSKQPMPASKANIVAWGPRDPFDLERLHVSMPWIKHPTFDVRIIACIYGTHKYICVYIYIRSQTIAKETCTVYYV